MSDLADAQMETTLLCSCLALPNISFALRTCPPNYIRHAIDLFDKTLRDSLEDLAGSPLSDWAWLKASLPSNRGGLNIRRASLHAPAAFLGSLQQTSSLVERILGHLPDPSLHLQLELRGNFNCSCYRSPPGPEIGHSPPLRALGTSFSILLLLFVGGTHAYGSLVSPLCLPLLTVSSDCSGSVFLVFCSTSCVYLYFILICACTLYIDFFLL